MEASRRSDGGRKWSGQRITSVRQFKFEIDRKEAYVSVMTEKEWKWWEQVEWSTDSASQPVINRKEEAACSQMEPLCLSQEHTPSVKFAVDPAHTKVLPGCHIAIFSDRTKYDETPRLEFQIDQLEEKVSEVAGVVSFPHVAKLVKRRTGPPPGFDEQASTVCSHSVQKASAETPEFFEATSFNDPN